MDTRHFHKSLFDATKRLIPPGTTVACAVSAGPDSIALLHALHRVNELRKLRMNLSVAHLDHRLPPNNSAEMATFTQAHSESLNLPYFEETIDVPALARQTGESIEEAGRKARYAFYERAARHLNASVIAVAHHADDQAETILHRILRGTNLHGLAGMPESRPLMPGSDIRIVRPLLALTRENILAYLKRREIPFQHDATNDDVAVATRNRIRHQLLPLIRETINPNVDAALLRLGRGARHASDFISEAADALFDSAASCAGCDVITLRVAPLQTDSPALVGEVLLIALRRLGARLKNIGAERLHAAIASLDSNVERRMTQLPNGHLAERRGKYLYIKRVGGAASDIADSANRATEPTL